MKLLFHIQKRIHFIPTSPVAIGADLLVQPHVFVVIKLHNAIDLSVAITDANGLVVVGNPLIVSRDIGIVPNSLQDGADAVAIFQGDGFLAGDTIGDLSGFIVIDALVYDTGQADDMELLNGLAIADSTQVIESGPSTTMAIQRTGPDRLMGGEFSLGVPSPGRLN